MHIGQVIRKYRKIKNITQDEMARGLGITTPAVNKWEKGNSSPDILLLAPIARLLDITLDTLLSFHEELTDEEVKQLIYEADKKIKSETYDEVFQWAKKKFELYPNCQQLILWMTQFLDAQRCIKEIPNSANYDAYICNCYAQILNSKDEDMRYMAADSLFGFYLRKEQYVKAEECLTYFSKHDPEGKRKQAVIYSKTDRINESYKLYEELLYSGYQTTNMVFMHIFTLVMKEKDLKKGHFLVEKQRGLANLFEMGEYHEVLLGLELATAEKDIDMTLDTMEKMLESIGKIEHFKKSALYSHLNFKELSEDFFVEMKRNLLENFRDEETFSYLKENKRWIELVK